MAHRHDHRGHGHHHHHAAHDPGAGGFGRAFALGTALNLAFVLISVIAGLLANSMALLAEAGHNFGDVLGLIIAWGGSILARRRPTARYTYGFGSSSILAALVNAVIILVATGGIAWEALRRLGAPEPIAPTPVIAVAALGVLVNAAAAFLFAAGRKRDLNLRGAFLHMAADAAISAGVAGAALAILLTGWLWLDPAVGLLIAAAIVWSAWGLLREAVALSLNAVPREIDPSAVKAYLESLAGVAHIHDLHIWAMSTTETALTCHLVMPSGHPGDAYTARIAGELQHRFRIGHATLQIEVDEAAACALASAHAL